MNILPKKRWHVRTKDNIARVRRDEAEAAAQEKERQRRALLAEQEARTAALRAKARDRLGGNLIKFEENLTKEADAKAHRSDQLKHVNLFEDIEDGKIVTNQTNAEYEREQKQEKEKYEKQIGYLTYLGQDTVEATGNISWYNKVPDRPSEATNVVEVADKSKSLADPLKTMKKYLPSSEWNSTRNAKLTTSADTKTEMMDFGKRRNDKVKCKKKKRHSSKHGKKCKRKRNYSSSSSDSDTSKDRRSSKRRRNSKKISKDSSSSSSETSSSMSDNGEGTPVRCNVDMDQLRAERLKREKEEQLRTQALLAKLRGEPSPDTQLDKANPVPAVKQKYNSQFNPELARQNFLHPAF